MVGVVPQQTRGGSRYHPPRRDRIRRRAGRLDDVVFENRGATEPAEDRDRQHRDRNRGADGEADLQREVDVRRAEDEAENHAEHDGAEGQLRWSLRRRDVRLVRGARARGWRCRMRRWDARHRRHNLASEWRKCPAANLRRPFRVCRGPMTESTDFMLNDLRAALADLYDIEVPIARGGMALVYLAREQRLDRPVAIKVLHPDLARDDTHRLRFLREARTVAQLTHPNIVPIFTVGDVEGFVFFAMAYVTGETLAQRVTTRGRLDPHTAGGILCDIGEALDYAHARGVVHRDVKPDNILIDEATGRALLSDFGVAHASPPSRASGQLGRPAAPRGHVVGTAAFMSPEQASGDLLDARNDIYSLGVLAYYTLSGRLPFEASSDEGFLAQHISDPAPKIATVVPRVPLRLAHIVDRCLSKEPWARYPDAAALVRAIAEAVAPSAAPLAIRAFMVRSTHLEAPALIHAFVTGVGLLPAAVAAWLSPATATARAAT